LFRCLVALDDRFFFFFFLGLDPVGIFGRLKTALAASSSVVGLSVYCGGGGSDSSGAWELGMMV
jgi:hypothetical protein